VFTAERIIGFWLLANLVAVGAYDVVATTTGMPTVSAQIQTWSKEWPALPLCVGLLIGHLFL